MARSVVKTTSDNSADKGAVSTPSIGHNNPPDSPAVTFWRDALRDDRDAHKKEQTAEAQYAVASLMIYDEFVEGGKAMAPYHHFLTTHPKFTLEGLNTFIAAALEAFNIPRGKTGTGSTDADVVVADTYKRMRMRLGRGINLGLSLMQTADQERPYSVKNVLSWYDEKQKLFVVPFVKLVPRGMTVIGLHEDIYKKQPNKPIPLNDIFQVLCLEQTAEGIKRNLYRANAAHVKFVAETFRGREVDAPMIGKDGKPMFTKAGKPMTTKVWEPAVAKPQRAARRSGTPAGQRPEPASGPDSATPSATPTPTPSPAIGANDKRNDLPGFQTMLTEVGRILAEMADSITPWLDLPIDETIAYTAIGLFVQTSLIAEYDRNPAYRVHVDSNAAMLDMINAARTMKLDAMRKEIDTNKANATS